MPNIKSAKKRLRQNEVRRQRNRSRISRMRTEIRRFKELVAENKLDEARAHLSAVYSVIDKTARTGVIHRNTGARHKSRLVRILNEQAAQTS